MFAYFISNLYVAGEKWLKLINDIINSRNNNGTPGCLLEICFHLKNEFFAVHTGRLLYSYLRAVEAHHT